MRVGAGAERPAGERARGGRVLTVVAGQPPAAGDTLHASGEVVAGLGHADGRHAHVHLGGAGQLDEQDVVVDGEAVVAGVLEHLRGGTGRQSRQAALTGTMLTEPRSHLAHPQHLGVLLGGRAVVLTHNHAVGSPATGETNAVGLASIN